MALARVIVQYRTLLFARWRTSSPRAASRSECCGEAASSGYGRTAQGRALRQARARIAKGSAAFEWVGLTLKSSARREGEAQRGKQERRRAVSRRSGGCAVMCGVRACMRFPPMEGRRGAQLPQVRYLQTGGGGRGHGERRVGGRGVGGALQLTRKARRSCRSAAGAQGTRVSDHGRAGVLKRREPKGTSCTQ